VPELSRFAGVTALAARGRALAAPAVALVALAGCVRPSRMCAAEAGCGPGASCVAGRCLAHDALPAIATARRLVYEPVDVAYLRPDAPADAAGVAALGRGDGAFIIARFAIPLAPEVSILEAYVLLDRATDVEGDPGPVTLHAERLVQRWDGGTVSWARQPRLEEVNAPETDVRPSSGAMVRLEVRGIVERWRRHDRDEMGLAVVAQSRSAKSATGMAFVLPPRLELYVK
jgi:hypothetical protein